MRPRARALVVAVLLAGCAPAPRDYPVPPQHLHDPEYAEIAHAEYVQAAQADADWYFVKDVKPLEGGNWRWTLAEPQLRFRLKSAENRVFRLELSVNSTTFRDTGPMKLAIFINGELLDSPIFDSPGEKVYQKPAPARLLKPNADNIVMIRVLNPWRAPDPGVLLGFVLNSAGFTGP